MPTVVNLTTRVRLWLQVDFIRHALVVGELKSANSILVTSLIIAFLFHNFARLSKNQLLEKY